MAKAMNRSNIQTITIFILILFNTAVGFADDVGITKARLIQTGEKSYSLEADVTQVLVWAIKAPIAIRLALIVERPAAMAPAITKARTHGGL